MRTYIRDEVMQQLTDNGNPTGAHRRVQSWLNRRDGVAVYQSKALDSVSRGQYVYMSYGSKDAQIEEGDPPEQMPDTGTFPTPWAYKLVGTCRAPEGMCPVCFREPLAYNGAMYCGGRCCEMAENHHRAGPLMHDAQRVAYAYDNQPGTPHGQAVELRIHLSEGETAWDPSCDNRAFYGPGVVTYNRHHATTWVVKWEPHHPRGHARAWSIAAIVG